MTKNQNFFQVGIILKTHGLKGELKVKSTTDFPTRFKIGSKLLIKSKSGDIPVEIAKSREQAGFWFITFKDLNDINQVEDFVGQTLFVTERNDQLEKDEFYVSDVVDLPVYTVNQEKYGKLKDVLKYGPNDVWVIENQAGKEILLPYTTDFIKSVDLVNQKIIIDLELYADES
ncbi:ribosome maturation factor RimM [Xylocopilactobacillus apis]|uniref:Ribosome maturation factor RimM n=1 Tax=Xylocopilactobacillus apis TaxID=2932183 RepID=A0AAU9D0V3_9LACO|nr:ribosome maturation factor RimM [Xylocopilactobacillus apis]BDR56111.1 ribosome maturation factor RimM [Xylocopilactobacillus apis]